MGTGRVVRIVIGLVVAAVGFAGVIILSHSTGAGGGNSGGSSKEVVVAVQPIASGTHITSDMVTLKNEDISGVPKAITSPAEVIGQYAVIAIPVDQVISSGQVSPTSDQLPVALASGHVAFTIADDTLIGAGNYISAKDHIDIITGSGANNVQYSVSGVPLQDIPVLEVGSAGQAKGSAAPDVLVLDVSRSQAEYLAALTAPGSPVALLRIVIRPTSDYGVPQKDQPVTLGGGAPSAH